MRRKPGELVPLEIEILEAATALERDGIMAFHGYSLAKSMRAGSDHRMLTAHGTLYRALHRLERAKLLEAFWEAPDEAEQEGRPRRRRYRLTALAAVALNRARARGRSSEDLRSLKGGLEAS
jgi:PadR family transcriptional regulator PadR